jgi:hypothetical protein
LQGAFLQDGEESLQATIEGSKQSRHENGKVALVGGPYDALAFASLQACPRMSLGGAG